MSPAPSPIGELLAVADEISQLAAGLTTPPDHLHGLASKDKVDRLNGQDARRLELRERLAAAVNAALRVETLPWLSFDEWSGRVQALRAVLADGLRLRSGDDYGAWCDRYSGPLERVDQVRARLTSPDPPDDDPAGDETDGEGGDEPYTVADLREYVRYADEYPAFLARLRSMTPAAVMGAQITRALNLTYWSALNCPQPDRITEEVAATLPTYQWFVRAARMEHGGEQTVQTFNLIVGMVAHRTGRTLPDLMDLPLTEFEALRAEPDRPPGHPPPPSSVRDAAEGRPTARTGGKRSSGRKPTDSAFDKRVREAWSTGTYRTYAELARALGRKATEVKASLDRSRKRPKNGAG